MKTLQKITIALMLALLFTSCSSNSGNNGCEECAYTKTASETAGTVDASITGELNLTFTNARTGSPIANGTKGTFTISNNELTVEIEGKDCITLKNPISPGVGSTEAIFKDTCRDHLFYAVSVAASGGLNEINLFGDDMTFYGQFKL